MTREEQIEQEWFRKACLSTHCYDEKSFKEGAKWADKTMIEKACKWLYHNTNKHIDDKYLTMSFNLTAEMIENFRKAMEE